jgi:hypothetical protein
MEVKLMIQKLEALHASIHQLHATIFSDDTTPVYKQSDVIRDVLSKLREEVKNAR